MEQPPVAFVDSSAIVALVDRDDATHAAAVEAYQSLSSSGYRLFTTDHVIVEAYDLLSTGVGGTVARQWLLNHRLPVYCTTEEDLSAARSLILSREDVAALSFTDAISLAVMERLGVNDAFAVDPAFLAALG
jgi:predicted nucleic acid-binding protein